MSQPLIPRHYVFVLQNGAYVVRLPNARLFDVVTGDESAYDRREFGHAITDGELQHLKTDGHIRAYSTSWVQITRNLPATVSDSHRVKGCYIATTLPTKQLHSARDVVAQLRTSRLIFADVRGDTVVILGPNATPFTDLNDAEIVLQQLRAIAPNLFASAFVAVYEVALSTSSHDDEQAIADQVTTLFPGDVEIVGRKVFVVGLQEDHQAVERLLREEMLMDVKIFENGASALMSFEVEEVAIAVVDLALPDIHGWAFIQKLRERPEAANLSVIVVSDNTDDMITALKIARVSGFLPRPLDLAKLRNKIWMALQVSASEQ